METHKNLKIGFAGHGRLHNVNDKLKKRLTKAVMKEINDGCLLYTMGTYGDFDNLALTVCKELRQKYTNIEIEVVLTSINQIKNNFSYKDVQTVIYEIENEHYKNQIISSNRQMINSCTTLICYVDMRRPRSGAKKL